MNNNAEIFYDFLNGFLSPDYLPEELQNIPDLFSPDQPCSKELDIIYQKRSELIEKGVPESDLDVIFDGFERIMREIGGKMYFLGTRQSQCTSSAFQETTVPV
ncbi:MAG: hypothetical protein PUJ62_13190 [Lachnospiraceae bacterium]|nr:hypothetical protein [Lachnospiraceae bacterium]